MVVAIDGPAGSGKGTISSLLAKKCNLTYVDTGVTYRSVALKCLENNIDLNDTSAIIDIASKINIKFTKEGRTFLDNVDVSDKIRSKEVTSIASPVSSIPKVREYMVEVQRNMADGDIVMEGRDITTVVLPNADYKFYLDASVGVRAKRRYLQNQEKGINMSLEEIKESIEKRDYNDMHREVGALKRTDDQIYIDTSNMSIEEVVETIRKEIGR